MFYLVKSVVCRLGFMSCQAPSKHSRYNRVVTRNGLEMLDRAKPVVHKTTD